MDKINTEQKFENFINLTKNINKNKNEREKSLETLKTDNSFFHKKKSKSYHFQDKNYMQDNTSKEEIEKIMNKIEYQSEEMCKIRNNIKISTSNGNKSLSHMKRKLKNMK